MNKFEIHILGCGSAAPTSRHHTSSQIVNIREKLFMIDCGEGTQMQFRKSRLKLHRLYGIFISHLHGDHCFGLIGLISTLGLLGRTADLHIYAPQGLEEILRPQLSFFCHESPFSVIIHEHDTTLRQEIYTDRSVSVSTIPLSHRIPCAGFLFQERPNLPHLRADMLQFYDIPIFARGRIKAGEDWITAEGELIPNERLVTPPTPPRGYAYCSDTAYMPAISEQIRGVDLLYHEATFAEEDASRAAETFHSTARQAALVARQAQVKRLLIGHYSARYESEQLLLDEAQSMFSDTMLADEHLVVSL